MKPETGKVFSDIRYFLAFGLGSGLSPRAPGTAGSVVALALSLPMHALGPLPYAAIVIATLLVGVFVSDQVSRELAIQDPSAIVIDEFVGMWLTLFLRPPGWYWVLAGFCLFRLFDIAKPWPVGWLDRHVKGGAGIMIDDVAAGIYGFVALQALALGVARWWS